MAGADDAMRSGMQRLAKTTTAAEIVQERGSTKRVKVMSRRRLQELIHGVVAAEMARYADRLDAAEQAHMEEVARRRVQQVIERAGQEEQELVRRSDETGRVLEAIRRRIVAAGVEDEILDEGLDHLAGLIAQSESMTHYCLHNTMCLQEEVAKLRQLAAVDPPPAVGPDPDETLLLREVARGRALLDLCRAVVGLVDQEAVLDLALLLDEAPGADQVKGLVQLNDVVQSLVLDRLA